MCGIAGIVLDHETQPETSSHIIKAMGASHSHRGPDDQGVWSDGRVGLGCVRLSIVGDSVLGHQPLHDRWGGIVIFNGEIYNFEDLLAELSEEVPAGASDGLALAALLAVHGPRALGCARGMFACARYDPRARKLLLVRDPVGKKPLYLRRFAGGWAFASTIGALHAATGPMQIRHDAIFEYLIFRSVGACHSAFQGVTQLPPGSWIEIGCDGSLLQGAWWSPPTDPQGAVDPGVVRDVMDLAVLARSRTSHEVGVFLSGGLDSAIVAASLRRQRPQQAVRLFSIGYDVKGLEDERPMAGTFAASLGYPFEDLELHSSAVPTLLADVARATEDPIQDPVTLPTLLLAREASRYTKVVLTGDGSDEIWGGYARFDDVPETLAHYFPRLSIFSPSELGLTDYPSTYAEWEFTPISYSDPLDRVVHFEVSNRLRNYHLARLDKLTMSTGLEARCPFLDVNVLNLALSLPSKHKRLNDVPKGLLAKAFVGDLPRWLLARKKQPFSVPIRVWLAGPLREFAHDTLLSSNSFVRGLVQPNAYLDALDREGHEAALRASKTWSLLQLELWYQTVVRGLGQQSTIVSAR